MDKIKMKLINVLFILVFIIGCSNNEALVSQLQEKEKEIEQLKKRNFENLNLISKKDTELTELKTNLKDSQKAKPKDRKNEPQKATLKDGTKILAYDWEVAPKEIFNIPVGDSYFFGPEDAKVTILEWMDYQ